jgi:hypothetical protein
MVARIDVAQKEKSLWNKKIDLLLDDDAIAHNCTQHVR